MRYRTVSISPIFLQLLQYIVKYRKLRGKATTKLVVEQIILAYAKQLVSGMPEPVWRANMLALINESEKEHQEEYKREMAKHKALQERAAKIESGNQGKAILRRLARRKTFKGRSKETY